MVVPAEPGGGGGSIAAIDPQLEGIVNAAIASERETITAAERRAQHNAYYN
jgi:hypothetical protein